MGMLRRSLSILLLAAVLQSCGGGREAVPSAPQQAVDSLRARALAVAAQAVAVAPDEAARQLMDFGEAQFPQYFPSRQPTQSLPPFAYRYYPQTGVYLGVVVSAGLGNEYLGVHVMGGPFGEEPQFVGPLASFITPLAPDRLVKVHVSHAATYALTAAGELFATGVGFGCRLGDGSPTDRPTPVSLGRGWVGVTGGDRLLALKDDGSLWGWGVGNVGDGTGAMRCVPTRIGDGYRKVAAWSSGGGLAVAVKIDGSLWVWNPGPVPTRVGTDTDWIDAVAGEAHYLALKADGSLWSWNGSGVNLNGELGREASGNTGEVPGRVGSATYKAMGAGRDTSYAITTDGDLHGWGRSSSLGPLGDGGTENRWLPVRIGGGYASVHPAATRVVALKSDGSVWAWGENGQFGGGPIGDGTQIPRTEPFQLAGGYVSLSNSEGSVLGIDQHGDVWGWDVYDYVRHLPSGNFGVLSSRVPVKFDYFAP